MFEGGAGQECSHQIICILSNLAVTSGSGCKSKKTKKNKQKTTTTKTAKCDRGLSRDIHTAWLSSYSGSDMQG